MPTTLSYMRSAVSVPMTLKDQVIGILELSSSEPNFYTMRHAELAMAIANQAAVAIENARLYAEVQDKVAFEERQRLARELHDSVSQALYGIVLGTETARTLLNRDPGQVAAPLAYVHSLAATGLAEMRALIFELRPESLESEGLVAVLTMQIAALRARYQIEVDTVFGDEPSIPVNTKEALYRIAQEALHNIVRHAEASHVVVRLDCDERHVLLEVRDNGVGFDVHGDFPGHLGLRSMRERAMRLGGSLEVDSTPEHGATIRALIPCRVTKDELIARIQQRIADIGPLAGG